MGLDLPGVGTAVGVIAAIIYKLWPSKEGALYNQAMDLLNQYDKALKAKDTKKATTVHKRLMTLLEKAGFTDAKM